MKITFTEWHIIYKIYSKVLTGGQIENFFKKSPKLNFSLTASLTTVASLEVKQSGARPPFHATITNSPVGCTFSSVGPPHLVFSFIFNQAACLLLHPTKL